MFGKDLEEMFKTFQFEITNGERLNCKFRGLNQLANEIEDLQ
jgi:hypothetical protein